MSCSYEFEIHISAPYQDKIGRIPNKLLWAINSFLSAKYELCEYSLFSAREADQCLSKGNSLGHTVNCPGLFRNRVLSFTTLNQMHLKNTVNMSETKLLDDYKRNVPAGEVSIEYFREVSEVEMIGDLNYFATESLSSVSEKIRAVIAYKKIRNEKSLHAWIARNTPISLRVHDHDTLWIRANDAALVAGLCGIIQTYEESLHQ